MPEVLKCDVCGGDFLVKTCRVGEAKYCSNKCKGEAQRTSRVGRKNPNFKHGRRAGNNIRGWSIAAKGESRCRSCGAQAEHLHHAIPRRTCPALRRDLRNGLPLCKSCHTRWHMGRPIRREVFTPEEWECLSTATITGWQTMAWLDKHYPSAASIAERALVVA